MTRAGVFLDTSVLLPGLIEMGSASAAAQRIMTAVCSKRLANPHTAWHCCLEFYAVSTRLPHELRLLPADARRLLEEEILGRLRVHQLRDTARPELLETLERERVAGGRTYDVHIAEIARQAGARVVVTDNLRHFTPLLRQGVQVASAADFVAEAGL